MELKEPEDIFYVCNTLQDGQGIRVTLASGKEFTGVYDAEQTDPDVGLFFETSPDGREVFARWENITNVDFRTAAQITRGRFNVPPEHPMSGQRRSGVYTTRND